MTTDQRKFTSPAGAIFLSEALSAVTSAGSGSEHSEVMKKIPISCWKPHQNTVTRHALVDDEDFDFLNQWKWSHSRGYVTRKIPGDSAPIRMHRLILNPPKGLEVDHKDGNGLNNQRRNLRMCTHAENCRNRKLNNKTGAKGARRYKNTGKFLALITKNGKKHFLGYFSTLREAQKAYNKAAVVLYGEFARLNPVT